MKGKLNVLVAGGTGTGKTTTLNALSSYIPGDERIVTIEDAAELQLQQDHVITLESRPPNIEGKGEVRIRELVRNALRMRPDRIIVGEVRGAETLDMLQAMNTGHEGSLTTIHANTPRDALSRLETLVLTAGVDLPLGRSASRSRARSTCSSRSSASSTASRRVTHVTEVLRMESDVITLQDIFVARLPDEQAAVPGRRRALLGPLASSGLKPHFLEKMAANGVTLTPDFFEAEDGVAGGVRPSLRRVELRRRTSEAPRGPPSSALAALALVPSAAAGAADPPGRHERLPDDRRDDGRPRRRRTARRRSRRTARRSRPSTSENLGQAKSIVLAIDRSQSMEKGHAFDDARRRRAGVRRRRRRQSDRVAIVGFALPRRSC